MKTEYNFLDKIEDLLNKYVHVMTNDKLYDGTLIEVGKDYMIIKEHNLDRIININNVIHIFENN